MDLDRTGCDSRNDVLRRDLIDPVVREGTQGCKVDAGTLAEPYTGTIDPRVGGRPKGAGLTRPLTPAALLIHAGHHDRAAHVPLDWS